MLFVEIAQLVNWMSTVQDVFNSNDTSNYVKKNLSVHVVGPNIVN